MMFKFKSNYTIIIQKYVRSMTRNQKLIRKLELFYQEPKNLLINLLKVTYINCLLKCPFYVTSKGTYLSGITRVRHTCSFHTIHSGATIILFYHVPSGNESIFYCILTGLSLVANIIHMKIPQNLTF